MTEKPVTIDRVKSRAKSIPDTEADPGPLAPDAGPACVYAAYWQARSGFFRLPPTAAGNGTATRRRL